MIEINQVKNNIDNWNFFFKIKSLIKDNENHEQTYENFKDTLKVNYNIVYIQILAPILILVSIIYFSSLLLKTKSDVIFVNFANFLIISLLIGIIFHNIQNIVHAGIHHNLHKNKKISDIISNILGIFTASEISEVRKIHSKHHTLVGTYEDPEGSYLYPLTIKKIIFYFLGIAMIKYAINYTNQSSDIIEKNLFKKIQNFLTFHRSVSLGFHLLCLTIFFFYLNNLIILFAWIYAFFAFLPFFNSMQNILEHAEFKEIQNTNDYKVRAVNRNFKSDFFSKYIYGNFGSNKHALHHWDPTIHYLCLDKIYNFLKNSNIKEAVTMRDASYFKSLRKIL
jgi:fatty acid desaturase